MSWTFVQDDGVLDNTSGTALAQLFGLSVTSGSLLTVVSAWESTDTTCVISDTLTSPWVELTVLRHPNTGGKFLAAHYAVADSSGANTVTQTLGAARSFRMLIVSEYSGGFGTVTAVLGKWITAEGVTANPTCGPLEVKTANELAWAAASNFNEIAGGYAAAGGFTERFELVFGGGAGNMQTQDLINPSIAALTAAWTALSDNHVRIFVLFRSELETPPSPGLGVVGYVGSPRGPFMTRHRRY